MQIDFASGPARAGVLVVLSAEGGGLGLAGKKLDGDSKGALGRAIAAAGFQGKSGEQLVVNAPEKLVHERIVIVGVGKADKLDESGWIALGGRILQGLNAMRAEIVSVYAEPPKGVEADPAAAAARLMLGMRLREYRFARYKTKEKPESRPTVERIKIVLPSVAQKTQAEKLSAELKAEAAGVAFARDLVNEPANILTPDAFAKRVREMLQPLGVRVEIHGEAEIKRLGLGALLAVGQGSEQDSQLVVLEWRGAGTGKKGAKRAKPLALIGKGMTFDSGGISIKPAAGMEDMKMDMAGAAAVAGTFLALATAGTKADVVGVLALAENMPSGTAQRPGDIVRSLSGQTIEVLNTDAEGRMILGDALWYAQDRFDPAALIDLATLTGAIVVALGGEHAGLFSNDDALAGELFSAGEATGEKLWRMPMTDYHDKLIDSDHADMKNLGDGRNAGATAGAVFLQRFVKPGVPWAHLDIAGTAWSGKDRPTGPKGATGYGVRLLVRHIAGQAG